MKFPAIALFLGFLAFTCKCAVQSNLFQQAPALAEFPEIRTTLEHLLCVCPRFTNPAAVKADEKPARTLAMRPLPKAETLVLIAAAAAKHNVPAAFVQSIVAAESNFDCAAISPKGAIGLMQLMPETANEFGADPAVPAQNIDAGTSYLRWLMNRYQNRRSSMKRVIAAYNAGPGMVDRYRGVPPFHETRTYVARVLGFLKQFGASPGRFGSKG